MSFFELLKKEGLSSQDVLRAFVSRNICCIASFVLDGEHVLEEIKEKLKSIQGHEEGVYTLYMSEYNLIPLIKCNKLLGIIPDLKDTYKEQWVIVPQQHYSGGLRSVNAELQDLLLRLV